MFENVFVGVDGSYTGREAIALGRGLAAPGGLLTLAHVQVGIYALTDAFHPAGRDDSQRLLEAERHAAGVDADLLSVPASSVGRGLHAAAEENSADLLVIGSCRRGLAGRILVGDDTRASLNGAPCAIAIAPRGYSTPVGGFGAIGVGFDNSPESHVAMTAARELAAHNGARLTVLRVIPQPAGAYASPMPSEWGQLLERDRTEAEAELHSIDGVEGTAVCGVAGEELAALGDRVDLLVVGSRSYGPTRRLILGSTSSRLVGHARCPLLVLPRNAISAAVSTASRAPRDGLPAGSAV